MIRKVEDSVQGIKFVCNTCLKVNSSMAWLFCDLTDDPNTPCKRKSRIFTPEYVEKNTVEFEEIK